MKYSEAIGFLLNLELFGIKLGLTNITKFLDRLGNPQESYQTVHVAGTNGKGSTVAMIEAMLVENGYKVGKYTSPHLVEYRERFRINKQKLSEEYVAGFVADHKEFIRSERITFFETATALALQSFKDEQVDFGVVEVGLGGRLDATNVLMPAVSAITQIALDHLHVLGNTLEKIAAEKAGIIKEGIPVVTSATDETALAVLSRTAAERGSLMMRLIPDDHYRVIETAIGHTRFSYSSNGDKPIEYTTNMPGRHMAENASLALLALDTLHKSGAVDRVSANSQGLRNVQWPGRFHMIEGRRKQIFDVAHNPHGMKALADTLDSLFPGQRFVVVLGVLQRPDFEDFFAQLARFTRYLVICRPVTDRAAEMEELVRNAIAFGLEFAVIEKSIEAYELAVERSGDDPNIVITGSHYTLGEIYAYLGIAP
ncbi:MAG: bifunctional folylpolyglutamate synthase/dihydrofolate synthase [candidate division Zixibacteria bacterium]|nr:bifunctional folylpolyglutamate synthase/dihydrofolate synthase [candidate division Zixibacteria bacterium]MBU1471205.1 bifunctional folylpolyglutamate synthase/dihydrofolate synthase [candidate division Zixibacteria bacterium]MBU2626458.1 bifunctional folylpolyglutamate synthase/dihydrofolate synthase [candidate division Zixibacteria bacterium]